MAVGFEPQRLSVVAVCLVPSISSGGQGRHVDPHGQRHRWRGWVDPLKEINANIVGLQNGVLSLQDVAAHYGRDVEEVFEAVERERELAESHGISLAFRPFGEKKPAEPIVE